MKRNGRGGVRVGMGGKEKEHEGCNGTKRMEEEGRGREIKNGG